MKPVSLDVNEVCFEEGQNIPNSSQKSKKIQSVTEWCRCGKWGVMHTNNESLSCSEVEGLGYFNYRIWGRMIGLWLPKELWQLSCKFT